MSNGTNHGSVLRLFAEQQLSLGGDARHRRGLKRILENQGFRRRWLNRIRERYPETQGLGDGEFLQWLIDHKDQIFAILTILLQLFM